jgi:hypothetical protein
VAADQIATRPADAPASPVHNPYSVLPNWLYPTFVAVVLGGFVLYALWVVFLSTQGRFGPYLSPMYSPEIHVGPIPPAVLVAWAPFALRFTCYYYRKAVFRSFLWHPRSCAVREPARGTYRGETGFWTFNNLHRYAFYVTAVQVAFLWYDVVAAFASDGTRLTPHLGLGAVIMLVNVVCLSAYTFGCHSFRHLAGGGTDCFSCHRLQHRVWSGVTVLNVRHDRWAWLSLATVWATDLYIRLLILGVIPHAPWV